MNAQSVLDILRSATHLQHLSEEALLTLNAGSSWLSLESQDTILMQGHCNQHVYLLVHGKFRYHIKDLQGRIIAQEALYPGDIVGEISAFNNSEAVATVVSARQSQVVKIDHEMFRKAILTSSDAINSITQKIIQHASNALQKNRRRKRRESIAVVPLNENTPVSEFISDLALCLGEFGTTGVVTRSIAEDSLDLNFAEDTLDDFVYRNNIETISKYIRTHDFVLFKSESSLSKWNQTIFNEVDRIMLVVDSRERDYDVGLQEYVLTVQKKMDVQVDVVFLHEDGLPQGSKDFLVKIKVKSHYHVWLNRKPTMERLARILSGKSVGLALGGGGARAAAHVGLIRALSESSIPIDFVGGTSIGAFIAAIYSSGLNAFEIEEILIKKVVGTKLFNDYTFPLISIVKGSKVSNLFQDIFGDRDIEDLPINFFATAVNISSTNLEILDEGKIWEAVRASSSLPAILPPFPHKKGLLVDGGLLDNVPGVPMQSRDCGFVIACDVGGTTNPINDRGLIQLSDNIGRSPTLWRFIKNKFSVQKIQFPRIPDIVTRCMLVGSKGKALETIDNVDIYVRMPVEKWGLFEFDSAKDLITIGYEHANNHSAEWRRHWQAKLSFDGA